MSWRTIYLDKAVLQKLPPALVDDIRRALGPEPEIEDYAANIENALRIGGEQRLAESLAAYLQMAAGQKPANPDYDTYDTEEE